MASSGLIIRQNERYEVSLPARVRVAHAHLDAVRFSRGVADPEGWLEAHLLDFSVAGAGFVTDIFLPKGAVFELEIPDPSDPDAEPLFHGTVRIMRIQMTDRRPAYLIGSALTQQDAETEAQIERLMTRLSGEGTPDA